MEVGILKNKELVVEIVNPEAIPEVSKRFTKAIYESYKKHLIEKDIEKQNAKIT